MEEGKKRTEELLFFTNQILAKTLDESASFLGRGGKGIFYNSGKSAGEKYGKRFEKINGLKENIERISSLFETIHIEIYDENKLTFRECPFRNMLEAAALKLDSPICALGHGFIAGLIAAMSDKKINLRTIHAGPNACLIEIMGDILG